MREIEFRGKLENSINEYTPAGSWVYGGYYFWRHGACIHGKDAAIGLYVDPETAGQYTGLKDRNGVRIFEGDIVKRVYARIKDAVITGVIVWEDYEYCFRFKNRLFNKWEYRALTDWTRTSVYEVIGNIHDNPELLEAEK